ncbi:MAG: phytase [Steroidobacteraceae bacterium]|nr:phytase [Steroidobacteraceae bacterium]
MRSRWLLISFVPAMTFAQAPVIPSTVDTAPFASYDEAPATVDADDPAIWVHPERPSESLIVGTLKDAGLVVYDLRGRIVQLIAPPNLPTVLPQDPPTPVGVNNAPPAPCAESEGETFGRFNNVDIAYRVKIGRQLRDIAVVTDRGCDRLRIYAIDATRPDAPLTDITDRNAPRLYPWRVVQPSPLQPAELSAGLQSNPLDEQDTGYGVGLWHDGDDLYAFVSQRNRSTVQQLKLVATAGGKVSYFPVRAFLFNPNFVLRARGEKAFGWTACRENANEDPQSEGIVIDAASQTLYVAFETIGVYRIPLSKHLPPALRVGREFLLEPVKSFGKPYWATPDDDEFECEYAPDGAPDDGVLVAKGGDAFAGEHLEVDVEGLAFYETGKKSGYLVVSSQGDNTFHVFDRRGRNEHLATFEVENTGDSDGVAITSAPLGRKFPAGIIAVQNGEAADPADTSDINGYEYDNSTQFRFVDWREVAKALSLEGR